MLWLTVVMTSMAVAPATSRLDVVRLAAVGDLHFGKQSPGALQRLLSEVTSNADVLALCGDLTDYGQPDEARVFAREFAQAIKIPTVAVLGNHD